MVKVRDWGTPYTYESPDKCRSTTLCVCFCVGAVMFVQDVCGYIFVDRRQTCMYIGTCVSRLEGVCARTVCGVCVLLPLFMLRGTVRGDLICLCQG